MKSKKVSIIVPVFREYNLEHFVLTLLQKVQSQNVEIIVVDGDKSGSTISKLEKYDVKTVKSEKGRGTQLKKGVENSTGDILLFLHADTDLPDNFFYTVTDVCAKISPCGAFSLKIDSNKSVYRVIEFFANFRARYFQMPFGDQAIFVERETYVKSGGFSEIPVFEDVDIIRKLKKYGAKIHILKEKKQHLQEDGKLKEYLKQLYVIGVYKYFILCLK